MKYSFILASLALSTCMFTGCSPKTDAPDKAQATLVEPETQAEQTVIAPPPHAGVFFGDPYEEIKPGSLDDLRPTNAERGFGFGAPAGSLLQSSVSSMVILDPDMKLKQLQITSYKGVAVNTEAWGSPVDDSNVAWLSQKTLNTSVHVDEKVHGLAVITFREPLTPGFYVLHDDSMLLAGMKDEVSNYYPFIVTDKAGNSAWNLAADQCFRSFHDEMGDNIPLKTPQKFNRTDIANCALNQRIAWKASESNPDMAANKQLKAIYLARLFSADNIDNLMLMKSFGKMLDKNLSDEIWKILQIDHIQRLAQLYAQATAHEALSDDAIQAVQAFYHPEITDSDDSRLKDPISTLSAVPFIQLENDDPTLMTILEKAVSGASWDAELIRALGAIQYRQLLTITQKNKIYATWFKEVEKLAPAEFRSSASSMSFKKRHESVIVGPMVFSGVPDEDISPWRATLATFAAEAKSCVPASQGENSGFYILEQPLSRTSMVSDPIGVLKDPLDSVRARPAIDPKTVSCILKAFSKIPALPSLEAAQKAYIAVSIQ